MNTDKATARTSDTKMTKLAVGPLIALALAGSLAGCGKSSVSYSLLEASSGFSQADATVNNKLDILWVVDNSGSMDPLQQNLANNFSSFISNFQTKGYDFQLAVTTSDAYLATSSYRNQPARAAYRDGGFGFPIISPSTPNLIQTFIANATQGSSGSGDERVFQSMATALASPLNSGFPRPGAFLAVVILSDEDDFSDPNRVEGSWLYGGPADHSYSNPGLVSIDSVIANLDQVTGSTAGSRRFNVSAITVLDNTCLASHQAQAPAAIIGQRYVELANRTNGVLGSVCDPSFSSSLQFIQQRIAELLTAFKLDRLPIPSTIRAFVNGVLVPQDAANGWTYDSSSNSVIFHGTGVPPSNARIQIAFDPVGIQ